MPEISCWLKKECFFRLRLFIELSLLRLFVYSHTNSAFDALMVREVLLGQWETGVVGRKRGLEEIGLRLVNAP